MGLFQIWQTLRGREEYPKGFTVCLAERTAVLTVCRLSLSSSWHFCLYSSYVDLKRTARTLQASGMIAQALPYKIIHNCPSSRIFRASPWKRLESSEESAVFRRALIAKAWAHAQILATLVLPADWASKSRKAKIFFIPTTNANLFSKKHGTYSCNKVVKRFAILIVLHSDRTQVIAKPNCYSKN